MNYMFRFSRIIKVFLLFFGLLRFVSVTSRGLVCSCLLLCSLSHTMSQTTD